LLFAFDLSITIGDYHHHIPSAMDWLIETSSIMELTFYHQLF
jgi:hypothetical protein